MNGRRMLSLMSALTLLVSAVGCGGTAPVPPAADTSVPASASEEMTLYDCGGLKAGIPAKYADLLVVQLGGTTQRPWGDPLLDVYEKASQDAFAADNSDPSGSDVLAGVGFLFGIARLDQAAYEQHLVGDYGGVKPFARDSEGNYYAKTVPTDVQFYRSGSELDTESEDWKSWETLNALGDSVCADFIGRNGLTAYDDSEFTRREFTFEGQHAYLRYFTYHTFDGDDRMWDTLVLSQPAKQGEGGIWCVERFYDCYGTLYYQFPLTGASAAETYAQLQAQCDGGERSDLLTPLGAAEDFAKNSTWYDGDKEVTAACFAETDGPDTAYFEQNAAISQLIYSHMLDGWDFSGADAAVLPAFLERLAAFTSDTWGVLGRYNYGSDWWPTLQSGVSAAAVGADQQTRDEAVMHLYLTAPGAPYTADLAAVLQVQWAADGTAFDAARAAFSPQEQLALQAAAGLR